MTEERITALLDAVFGDIGQDAYEDELRAEYRHTLIDIRNFGLIRTYCAAPDTDPTHDPHIA